MEKNVVETVLENMPEVIDVDDGNGRPYSIIPASMQVIGTEKYLERPRSIEQIVSFSDVTGFQDYIHEFKVSETILFASDKRIEAIFEYHGAEKPSWCRHRARYNLSNSPEWIQWKESRKRKMSQTDFATFLESLLPTIESPAAADVLSVVRAIRATVTSKVISLVSDDGINASLEFKRDVEVKGAGLHVELPKELTIIVSPFFGIELNYKLKVRLGYELKESERTLLFSYDILNFERASKDAFDELVKMITFKTGVKCFVGGSIEN